MSHELTYEFLKSEVLKKYQYATHSITRGFASYKIKVHVYVRMCSRFRIVQNSQDDKLLTRAIYAAWEIYMQELDLTHPNIRIFRNECALLESQQLNLFDYLLLHKNEYIQIDELRKHLRISYGRTLQLYKAVRAKFGDSGGEYFVITRGKGLKLIFKE